MYSIIYLIAYSRLSLCNPYIEFNSFPLAVPYACFGFFSHIGTWYSCRCIHCVGFSLIHSDLLIEYIQKLLELLKEAAFFVTLFI